MEGEIRVKGVLNKELTDDERTATTADLKTLVRDLSDSDSEGEEDFSAENRLCLPPEKMLYTGNDMSVEYAQDVLKRRDEPPKMLSKQQLGRSKNGLSAMPTTMQGVSNCDVAQRTIMACQPGTQIKVQRAMMWVSR